MPPKKRSRAMYSADDTDDDSNVTLVHDEQTTYEETGYRKIVSFSQLPSNNYAYKCESSSSKVVPSNSYVDNDLDDFFSSTVQEVTFDSVDDSVVPSLENEKDADSSDDDELQDEEDLEDYVRPVKQRYRPLDDFRELKTEFVEQLMRKYGPNSVSESCCICGVRGEAILCSDCFTEKTRCQECILRDHIYLPLHRVQYFDGCNWQKTTLRELGLIVNLGHNCAPCPASNETRMITVIDVSGIQDVNVLFCTCESLVGVDATERSQLLNHGWFPATTEHPGTVATFAVLDAFEALSGEGKLSGYHFYKSLVRIKDGAGYESIPRRYEEFMRMTREYEHLKMIIRAGKMSDSYMSTMPISIADGELAVQCPACPHPGQNIPVDWERRVDSWIYTLYIMIDANFRLKSKKKRTADDPDLGDGNSYFVRSQPYMQHLGQSVEEKEIKYCDSGLRAVDHANLKGGRGYNASGVVGVQCRHMLIRGNGVGDLQKGEKYANVDYVVLSSLRDLNLKRLVMSYDIVCQYSRNFKKRMLKFDNDLQLNTYRLDIGFVIPQFHIAGHGDSCRTRYNLRFREHVGRTDGENIERGWAALNPLSMASKEMGTGSRHDYLDWHIGDWNYQRIVSFGRLFTKKLNEAVDESLKHSVILSDFRKTFPKGIVKEIEDSIRTWDEDPYHAPDPYTDNNQGKSILVTQTKITEQELKEEVRNIYSEVASEVQWLVKGLELEDVQHDTRKLFKDIKTNKVSSTLATASEKNLQTLRKIRVWKSEQLIHMPRVSMLPQWELMPDYDTKTLRCWRIRLLLPSSIDYHHRRFSCSDTLTEKERKLRIAQAYDSLMEVRHLIQKEWWLRKKKKKHVSGPGQKMNTKSNCAIDVVVEQRECEVARYRRAREALVALEPDGQWQRQYRPLQNEDIRHFEDDEGKGEGRRSPSWIWRVQGATTYRYDEDAVAYEGLKVEYAKTRARAFRWLEEVQLIREEMRRVISYFNWKIGWWLERNSRLEKRNDEAALGAIVYGNRQILILQSLGRMFRQKWQTECDIGTLPEIRSDCSTVVKTVSKVPRFHDVF